MVSCYIPDQGDIITIEFDPQAGHEQKGKWPALVISNKTFNSITKMAFVCPITNTMRGFPLHVLLDNRTTTTGVIMCEQLKSFDLTARNLAFREKAPLNILENAINKIYSIVEKE